MSAGSSKVLIYIRCLSDESKEDETTHKHEYRAILAFTAPVLRGVGCITHVVGLTLL